MIFHQNWSFLTLTILGKLLERIWEDLFAMYKYMDNIWITKEEAVLKRIKVDKSPGPDQVHPLAIWEAQEEIEDALAKIFASF